MLEHATALTKDVGMCAKQFSISMQAHNFSTIDFPTNETHIVTALVLGCLGSAKGYHLFRIVCRDGCTRV